VQANLAEALGGKLAPEDAERASGGFVEGVLNNLRAGAARETLGVSPEMRALNLASARMDMLGLQGAAAGPRTVGAGDFARGVQDGQKPMAERLKEQIDIQRKQLTALERLTDETRRQGLVGP
jgi:hypothetical protein